MDDNTEATFTGKDLEQIYLNLTKVSCKKELTDIQAKKYLEVAKPKVVVEPKKVVVSPAGLDQIGFRNKDLKPTANDAKNLPKHWYIARWYDSSTKNWVATLYNDKQEQMYSSMYVYSKKDVLNINFDY